MSLAIKVALLLCVVGGAAFIYYTKRAEQQQIATREQLQREQLQREQLQREQQRTAELEKRIADLSARSEAASEASALATAAAKAATAATAADSEKRKISQWNSLIDKVIIKLERVKDEDDNFSSATTESALATEQTRLKTLSREQESAARSIVVELKALGFPKADELDRLVHGFVSDYGFFTSYKGNLLLTLKVTGSVSDEAKAGMREFMAAYYEKLRSIQNLKSR